jgi:hypothetical protein
MFAAHHPMTQGKIERRRQTLKNRILLENYCLPGDLEAEIDAFVADHNHLRYHESLDSLTRERSGRSGGEISNGKAAPAIPISIHLGLGLNGFEPYAG